MPWQPTVGKWNDDENYDTKDPLWKRLLFLSSEHGDIKRLQEILSWFNNINLHGDYVRTLIIGCFLHKAGVDLKEYFKYDKSMISDIVSIAEKGNSINECAISVMKKVNTHEYFINEFKKTY